MTVVLQDILDQTNDLLQNYNVSNIDPGNKTRAINRAIEFVQRRLGLPSDKKIQSFYFYEDTPYYDCATGFNELLGLKYNTSANTTVIDKDPNTPRARWNVYKDIEILQNTGVGPDENQVAFTTLNSKNQLLLHGKNQRGSQTIQPFSNTSGLTYSTDIPSIAVDSNVYKYSNGSIKFTINTGGSASCIHFSGLWDITKLLNLNAAYKLFVDFPTGTTGYFSNVELRLQSSVGNYYSMTTTTQDDGTAWNSGTWSRLVWQLSNATLTGTPAPATITDFYIYFNHSGSFATTTDMRINYLYQITPDYIDAIYYSAYKGTDLTGTTPKILLNTVSDIASFGDYAQDLIYPISLHAAKILSPQLLADPNFRSMYKEDFEEAIRNIGRIYPRERSTGVYGKSYVRR